MCTVYNCKVHCTVVFYMLLAFCTTEYSVNFGRFLTLCMFKMSAFATLFGESTINYTRFNIRIHNFTLDLTVQVI